MNPTLIVGIITAVAGLLTTILGWLLNQLGISRQAKELEVLILRLDIIDKLSKLQSATVELDTDIEKLRKLEMKAVLAEISDFTDIDHAGIVSSNTKMSWWNRTTLSYDQISLKGRIYKGLFYSFTLFSVLGSLGLASVEYSDPAHWGIGLVGGLIYFFIGLSFRRASIRTYAKDKKKAVAQMERQ